LIPLTLDPSSTFRLNDQTGPRPTSFNYGNLILSGTQSPSLSGNLSVSGTLEVANSGELRLTSTASLTHAV
jgi:hypothetical protein